MPAGKYFEVPTTLDGNGQWGYSPRAKWRTAQDILPVLIRLTAKGGNYLINIGPDPDGQWAPGAVSTLTELAAWMSYNKEAIHGTVPVWPYEYQNYASVYPRLVAAGPPHYFTASTNGTIMYVLVPLEQNTPIPTTFFVPYVRTTIVGPLLHKSVKSVQMLGQDNSNPVVWSIKENGLTLQRPSKYTFLQVVAVFKITFAPAE